MRRWQWCGQVGLAGPDLLTRDEVRRSILPDHARACPVPVPPSSAHITAIKKKCVCSPQPTPLCAALPLRSGGYWHTGGFLTGAHLNKCGVWVEFLPDTNEACFAASVCHSNPNGYPHSCGVRSAHPGLPLGRPPLCLHRPPRSHAPPLAPPACARPHTVSLSTPLSMAILLPASDYQLTVRWATCATDCTGYTALRLGPRPRYERTTAATTVPGVSC